MVKFRYSIFISHLLDSCETMISNISDINLRQYQAPDAANVSSESVRMAQFQHQAIREKQSAKSNGKTDLSTRVTLSEEAMRKLGLSKESQAAEKPSDNSDENSLSTEELKELANLKTRDREVRAHEMAHVMAGGSLVRKGASYQYEMGPDGVRYAVSGEVSIDTSAVEDDPAATIQKMQKVKRAALAPAEPSAQDRSVAASASQVETAARQELQQQSVEEQ